VRERLVPTGATRKAELMIAYGGPPGKDGFDHVTENAAAHEKAQSGADARPNTEQTLKTLSTVLQHERKGPYEGRRGGGNQGMSCVTEPGRTAFLP